MELTLPFSSDDVPMGTAARRASNEFFMCGGYVYIFYQKRNVFSWWNAFLACTEP